MPEKGTHTGVCILCLGIPQIKTIQLQYDIRNYIFRHGKISI